MRADRPGAYQHWDRAWRSDRDRSAWSTPEPWVVEVAEQVAAGGGRRVLDLGCGIGRHALLLAGRGFDCHAVDRSWAGLGQLRDRARRAGVTVALAAADFARLPYAAGRFDYVLAWNVVYHGDPSTVRRAVAEIARLLRPGGLYQATMLSKRNSQYGLGVEIDTDTFVQPEGGEDKRFPHLYCDADDVARLYAPFGVRSATEVEQAKPGSYHWNLLLEREAA